MAPPKTARTNYVDLPVVQMPVSNWTKVRTVQAALNELYAGNFRNASLMADAMDEDDRIFGCFGTRLQAVSGCPLEVRPADSRRRSAAIAQEVQENWNRWFPPDQRKDLMRWGRRLGIGVAEIRWHQEARRWTPETIRVWHPTFMYWLWNTQRFYMITADGDGNGTGGVELNPGDGKWLIYTPGGYHRAWMHGLLRPLAVPWLVRTYARRDWARYSEVHGLPARLLKVPTEAPDADKTLFYQGVRRPGSELVINVPCSSEGKTAFGYELVEAKADTWNAFQGLVDHSNAAIAIAILGQNLTTEVGTSGASGSKAAAVVHDRVRLEYLEDDATTLCQAIEAQVLRPWAEWTHGDAGLAPHLRLRTDPPADMQAKATTLSSLATGLKTLIIDLGAPIDLRAVLSEYAVPMLPEPDPEAEQQPGQAEPPKEPPPTPVKPDEQQEPVQPEDDEHKPVATEGRARPHAAMGLAARETEARVAMRRLADARAATRSADYVEGYGHECAGAAQRSLAPFISDVRAAVDVATDFDDLRDRLVKAYARADTVPMEKPAADAKLLADLHGRLRVQDEAKT